ncbi:NrsF family protein [Rhizobium sp. P40RR-XXII]|uniref:NrsF family protein n=1 Tax=Rhizobium sp. P40RR-XXII TaxID=2726739 RepID=UPI001FEF2ECC|nr:NrsF family protein [Rhizobium sp. P40RR-XXII]
MPLMFCCLNTKCAFMDVCEFVLRDRIGVLGSDGVKTEDLITLMAQDTRRPVNLSLLLAGAVLGGAVLAAMAFFATIGFRHDIAQAVETVRFIFKFVVTLTLLATAVSLLGATVRPGRDPGARRWVLLAAPVLLLAATAMELSVTPSQLWLDKLVGHNALHCLTIIPALSLLPGFLLFVAMRQGAPEHPGLAGALAGLISVGIAATLYASNCFDDSPLFVVIWYPLATLIVTAVGYVAGRRFLRW